MTPSEPPRRLGRGLDALLSRTDTSRDSAKAAGTASGDTASAEQTPKSNLRSIPIADIRPNPYQPRQEFHPDELGDLESSLKVSGLLQPITVRPSPTGNGYELIAGERRFRASSNIGWKEIPAIVRDVDDKTLLTLAMVENLQRSDLDPIEEADGYYRLMDEFLLSQQEVADIVGKDRSTVANAIRLRQLPASVRRMLQEKQLTAGHARALLSLTTEREIVNLARETVSEGFSVREVERQAKIGKSAASGTKKAKTATGKTADTGSAELRRLEQLLQKKFQTSVKIQLSAKNKGAVHIDFFSNDDLERLLELFGVGIDF